MVSLTNFQEETELLTDGESVEKNLVNYRIN